MVRAGGCPPTRISDLRPSLTSATALSLVVPRDLGLRVHEVEDGVDELVRLLDLG